MRHLIMFTVLAFVLSGLTAQTAPTKKQLLIKTWILSKYQEGDAAAIPAPEVLKNDYTIYKADGTYESFEQGLLIKGKWTLNEATSVLTLTQTQVKEYPASISVKILRISATELVLVSDATPTTKKVTLYLKPKV